MFVKELNKTKISKYLENRSIFKLIMLCTFNVAVGLWQTKHQYHSSDMISRRRM